MKTVNLYKYEEANGVIVTPNARSEEDAIYAYRLIADEGKILKHGDDAAHCIDTHTPDDWTECEDDTKETSDVEE